MQKKIVINFKTGKVTTYGRIEDKYLDLAKSKLHWKEVEPCRKDKATRIIKKFIKCLKYALNKKEPTKHITVCRPLLLEGVNCIHDYK